MLGIGDDPDLVLQVHRRRWPSPACVRRGDQLADGVLRPRRLAARQGGDGAKAGVLQALGPRRTSRRSCRARPRRPPPAPSAVSSRASRGSKSSGQAGGMPSRCERRSFIRVTSETFQPSPTAPSRWAVRDAHVGEIHLVEARLRRWPAGSAASRRPGSSCRGRTWSAPCAWARSGSVRVIRMP